MERRREWEPLQVLRGSSDGKSDEEGGGEGEEGRRIESGRWRFLLRRPSPLLSSQHRSLSQVSGH